ncbi:MAG: AraC family transcriptional regulator [Bacteroidia bacterium]|jgi:AraC-like DNA-binding protein|nr:AraC family transcriptional regulator [Bacteroidia bacterium]
MQVISITDFYKELFGTYPADLDYFLGGSNNKNIGHFNVFDTAKLFGNNPAKVEMPYNRRTYYKISLINGRSRVDYADKTIEIKKHALLFSTPKIPYRYNPLTPLQAGHFCVFTKEFITKSNAGVWPDQLPVFGSNSGFIYEISAAQYKQAEQIFLKMHQEIASDYAFKYDLLRNYTLEIIHFGQKLSPIAGVENTANAGTRISALFIELLERQFPVEQPGQMMRLQSAKDFADVLGVHTNHLNKVLKETTGKTTTEIIAGRIAQEAKILLLQTNWNVSEIAYALGFEEVAHFSNFFKKQTSVSPVAFRAA